MKSYRIIKSPGSRPRVLDSTDLDLDLVGVDQILYDCIEELTMVWGEMPSLQDPDNSVILAELCNRTAKIFPEFYQYKGWLFAWATTIPGVRWAWYEEVFHIQGPLTHSVGAHDPYGDIDWCLAQLDRPSRSDLLPDPWDGKARQWFALNILRGLPKTRNRQWSGEPEPTTAMELALVRAGLIERRES